MTGLQFQFEAFNKGANAPTQVQILAKDLVERIAALATQGAAVAQQAQHQGRLLAANCGMGLVTPGQDVQVPPNLGFDLTCNQELVLAELAQRTRLVDTRKYFLFYPSIFPRPSVTFILPAHRCHFHR